jgi:hypothetical protein
VNETERRPNVESHPRYQTRSLWLAALAALIVLVLVSFWRFGRSTWNRPAVVAEASGLIGGTESASLPPAVDAFTEFVRGTRARDAMAVGHEFTATGIRNLTAALEAIAAARGSDVQRELAILREQADVLEQNPSSSDHADRTRAMFITLSGLMAAIQATRLPDLRDELADVKRAAEQVDAASPLLDQSAPVQDFFDRAAAVVEKM